MRSPVDPLEEFAIEKLTFGQTLAPVPFITERAEVEEVIFPKVIAFCLELNIFQSVLESAHVVEVPAIPRERVEPETERPLFGIQIEILQSFELKFSQSLAERSQVIEFVAVGILKVWVVQVDCILNPVPLVPVAKI